MMDITSTGCLKLRIREKRNTVGGNERLNPPDNQGTNMD